MFRHQDVAQRATIRCLHIGSAHLPVMLVLESRGLNENSHAEKILMGLFNVQNNRHRKQQSLQIMCTEWEVITMCMELLQYAMLMKILKKLGNHQEKC